jgi:uncharacterized membrane protein SpoIIM required for sporulation
MREALFIKRNKKKWMEYQQKPASNPDEQADRFITLLDDLAYSQTHYPQSKVTRWINGIATGIYQKIYQNKKEKYARLGSFWTTELPLIIKKHHRILLFSVVFFLLCVAMGAISSAKDNEFVKAILGADYVSMTEENISKGDPFGVYRDTDKFTMFIRIAFNNISVSFKACLLGIFFGLGTILILFYNGVMIGAFEYIFFSKGLGLKSVMVIWIHGTLEIWSIIIAGAAGFIIGTGILFPGTYSRMQSFKTSVKDAIKILLSLIPFFIAAAFLESYVTFQMSNTFSRNSHNGGMPLWASISILTASIFFISWYFIYLPVKVFNKNKLKLSSTTDILTYP